jgi:hypothetical protein
MAKRQPLSLTNIEAGDLIADANRALQEIQDAVLGQKTKGSLTIKISLDSSKSDSICAVGYELSKAVPKVKKSSLYNKGAHYLEAEIVPEPKGRQEEIEEVTNVVEMNRRQA